MNEEKLDWTLSISHNQMAKTLGCIRHWSLRSGVGHSPIK